ncbi:MAG: SIS domain-containing protein [Methanocellales archaeon]|nr:SIS domain-containing protein [Methanocellales archaeon]
MAEKMFYESLRLTIDHISSLYDKIHEVQVKEFVENLHRLDDEGKYTYVYGAGRSGLIGKALVTRLTNLKYNAFFIGSESAPAMNEGDAVILISGSGETADVVNRAKTSKELHAVVFGVTSRPESRLAKYCDHILEVPGKTKMDVPTGNYLDREQKGLHAPLSPLGNLFECSALIVLDSIISDLAKMKGITEEEMKKVHFE